MKAKVAANASHFCRKPDKGMISYWRWQTMAPDEKCAAYFNRSMSVAAQALWHCDFRAALVAFEANWVERPPCDSWPVLARLLAANGGLK